MSLTSWPPGTASINVRSKVALCASTGEPPTNSTSPATAVRASGASVTSRSVIEVRRVISGGMGQPGCTNVSYRSTTSRPRRRAALISIRVQSLNERPVVSVSSTTTSSSSRPKFCSAANLGSEKYFCLTDSGVAGNIRSSRRERSTSS